MTHEVSLLLQVDLILVIKDGQMLESGTYQELLDSKRVFSDFLIEYLVKDDNSHENDEIIDEVERKSGPELQRAKSVASNSSSGDVVIGSPEKEWNQDFETSFNCIKWDTKQKIKLN